MSPRIKAGILNFLFFLVIFLGVRFGLPEMGMQLGYIPLVILAFAAGSFLSPKFGVAMINGQEKVVWKWFNYKSHNPE